MISNDISKQDLRESDIFYNIDNGDLENLKKILDVDFNKNMQFQQPIDKNDYPDIELLTSDDKAYKYEIIKFSPLCLAIDCHQNHIVKWLLEEKKVDINFYDPNGLGPIHHASSNCNIEAMKLLLANNADVNFRENLSSQAFRNYSTAIFEVNSLEMAELLLSHSNLDLNIKDNFDSNVINHFASLARFEFCEILVKKLKSTNQLDLINQQNSLGNTALHSACSAIEAPNRYIKTINLFIANDADLTIKNSEDKYAYELIRGNLELKSRLENKTKEALQRKLLNERGDIPSSEASITSLKKRSSFCLIS